MLSSNELFQVAPHELKNVRIGTAYSEEHLILAARMYYLDGLTQSRVARLMGVSQAKVSRMLSLARNRNLIQINVPDYNPRDNLLEGQLVDRLGLEDAVVIRRLEKQSVADLRAFVGYFAAPHVSRWIPHSTSVIAIAAGRATRCLVDQLSKESLSEGLTVVQCMGTLQPVLGSDDPMEFGDRLARRIESCFVPLDVPGILPEQQSRESHMALPQVRHVLGLLEATKVAIVGIGTLENSVFREHRLLPPADIEQLKQIGAVGEIVGRFYDAAGNECDSEYRRRAISIELDSLRKNNRVIGVVAGCDRFEAIMGSIRGGILNYLVIDDMGAKVLLKGLDASNSL